MSILEDVDLASKTGFLRGCASFFCRLPNHANGHSEYEDRHGSTDRGRTGGRLLHRAALKFGSDNNYEYKLYGNFSGDKVYEPASNRVYPEFILKDYEVISTNPPPIFKTQISGRADAAQTRYMIEKPEPQF